jgi:septin family protein
MVREKLKSKEYSNKEISIALAGNPNCGKTTFFNTLTGANQHVGNWPGSVKKWVNIADAGDIVALEKNLKPLFNGSVEDKLVYNGSDAHSALNYLTAKETGEAIKWGII